MKVSLILFAGLKDVVGRRDLCMEIGEGATIADLKERLAAEYPRVRPLLKTLVFAIDDEYVAFEEKLHDGAEVALIPPVSGGAGEDPSTSSRQGRPGGARAGLATGRTALFRITTEPMQGQALADLVRQDESGAIALFYGVVRNNSEGRDVERLEYEAHESMALRKMRDVAELTKRRFPTISEIGVWHRIGTLEIGETSLLVAVASPHRAEAFEACHWAVDRVKEVVPVWKKEHWRGGAAWVEGHAVEPPQLAH